MQFSIRPATLEDAPAIAEVHVLARQAAYREFFPREYLDGLTVEGCCESWRDWLQRPADRCLVAAAGSRVAGHVHFGPAAEPDTVEVFHLHVHPDFWGRSLGAVLLSKAMQQAAKEGFRRAELKVYEANAAARGFYEHEGWRNVGETSGAERGGVIIRQLRYGLVLEGPS